jgi:hypothetical protein
MGFVGGQSVRRAPDTESSESACSWDLVWKVLRVKTLECEEGRAISTVQVSTDRSVCATDADEEGYWAEAGETRPGGGLLLVCHSELAEWTLSVYKLLIARKKVGKPSTT